MDKAAAISVTRNIFWVGFDEHGSGLRCNPYLIVDGDSAVLIDPGSLPDFPVMMRKVIDIVDPGMIELVVLGHQDPDVGSCIAVLEDVIGRSDLKVAAHTHTHRLIQHFGFVAEPFRVDENGDQITLKNGESLRFVHTPYAHAPGAIATYHSATRTMFTSDLFGGLSTIEDDLFKATGFPASMDLFHQAYMPSSMVLRFSLDRLRKFPIDRICPQHGCIIEGDLVNVAFEHLAKLPCGIDLMVGT